ncbi:MAG: hypothetical protein M2R46_02490 [Verrucomicrobia subdivision 3 bacterium]|nr:hypothetical protein [Limisphaerales bacterium]
MPPNSQDRGPRNLDHTLRIENLGFQIQGKIHKQEYYQKERED